MIKPRVFCLEPCRVDLTDAARFGKLVYVFDESQRRPSIWEPEFADAVSKRVAEMLFDPEYDFFLVSGALVPLAIAVSVLTYDYESFRALMFCTTSRKYVPYDLGDTTHAAT